jgi:hypothetical protein
MIEEGGFKAYIPPLYNEALKDPGAQFVLVLAAYPMNCPTCHKQRSEPHEYIRISLQAEKKPRNAANQLLGRKGSTLHYV